MADTMTATVLPKEIHLGVPAKMPQARSYLFRQQSTLQEYTYGQTITINVPRLQRSYLRKDSYLRFRLNGFVTPTTVSQSLVLDTCGAFGLFEKLEIFDYLGSTVLESISGIPQLSSLLLDMGLKEIIDDNVGSASAGLARDYTFSGDPAQSNPTTTDNSVFNATYISQNGTVYPPSSGVELTTGTEYKGFVTATSGSSATPALWTLVGHGLVDGQAVYYPTPTTNSGITANTVYYVHRLGADTWNLATTYLGTTYIASTAAASGTGLKFGLISNEKTFSREFSIPLLSFMGILSQKMVPLHNGYTIVLTVAGQKKPMFISQPATVNVQVAANTIGATALSDTSSAVTITETAIPSWNITDVNLQCQILELGPVAESMLLSSTQGSPMVVHTKAFRNYVSTVLGSTWSSTTPSTRTQELVLNLNLNVASLTNILWFMRPSAHTDSILYPSCGSRIRNMLQRWQFQYGSTSLPQNNGIQAMSNTSAKYPTGKIFALSNNMKYVDYALGSTECFQEFIKARPCYLPANRMNLDNYNVDTSWNTNMDQRATGSDPITFVNWKGIYPSHQGFHGMPRFAAGLNLQLINGKDGEIVSGLNTNGMNTSIRATFHPLYTDFMMNATVDAFAEYDSFINISPGIATSVSF